MDQEETSQFNNSNGADTERTPPSVTNGGDNGPPLPFHTDDTDRNISS